MPPPLAFSGTGAVGFASHDYLTLAGACMNKQDRKKLDAIVSKLETLKAEAESLAEEVRQMADAEQDTYDNLSEGLQGSERGQAFENAAQYLGEAADALETAGVGDALDALGNIDGN